MNDDLTIKEVLMLNHSNKVLALIISSLILTACHKAATLDNELALKILQQRNTPGYAINIVSNNPNAYAKDASGWTCEEMENITQAGLADCQAAGRSGAYLTFTESGKKLLIGEPWGDSNLRNARVVAISKRIQSIDSIVFITKTTATVSYRWVYDQYTAFASEPLKKLIPLNHLQSATIAMVVVNKQWQVKESLY